MPRLPIFQPAPGSPSLGHLPPVEAGSSMNPSKASRSQQCTPAGQHRPPATPPPKSSKSLRSPRRLSSKKKRNCTNDARQDLKPRSSSDEDLVLADKHVSGKKLSASEDVAEERDAGEAEKEKISEAKDEEEEAQEKQQNLVPRKAAEKCVAETGKELPSPQGSPPKKTPKKKHTVKKEKPLQLSVALTRSEIEEDMFAMTGLRLSRKPKKRPKKLQDVVDVRLIFASISGL